MLEQERFHGLLLFVFSAIMKTRTFVDRVTVHASGGRGGDGCMSFRREKFIPRGGPDGGDGGHGGNVTFVGDRDTDSLVRLYYTPHQRAPDGGHGKGKQQYGRAGQDLLIKVPCGTEVWDAETERLLGDIVGHGDELIVAHGGKGGRGNMHWTSSVNRAPRQHTPGEPGQQLTLRMELKLLADLGLVGFPNAGKSSLLAAVTDAHPRIAAYPFTTLHPIIGTLILEDYTRITLADIPGLIEGAHEGVGLGDDFLRHVERAPALVYVIDMAGADGRKPHDDYATLREELAKYDERMPERPMLVVANKMDVPEAAANLKVFKRKTKTRPIAVSALERTGLDDLKAAITKLYRETAAASG